MDEFLTKLAERLQIPDADTLSADETSTWPDGKLDELIKAGILEEIRHSKTVVCDQCEENCPIEPDIRTLPDGKSIGVCGCTRNPDIGRIEVDLNRLRQWKISGEKLETLGYTNEERKQIETTHLPGKVENAELELAIDAIIATDSEKLSQADTLEDFLASLDNTLVYWNHFGYKSKEARDRMLEKIRLNISWQRRRYMEKTGNDLPLPPTDWLGINDWMTDVESCLRKQYKLESALGKDMGDQTGSGESDPMIEDGKTTGVPPKAATLEQPWDDKNSDYMSCKAAIAEHTSGKVAESTLSTFLDSPQNTIRFMKQHRRKVHIGDFIAYARKMDKYDPHIPKETAATNKAIDKVVTNQLRKNQLVDETAEGTIARIKEQNRNK